MSLKDDIKEYAEKIDIDLIGFSGVEPFNEMYEILLKRKNKGLISSLESNNIDKRTKPLKLFPEGKSIIVLGKSYYSSSFSSSYLARYAAAPDYHMVLKEKQDLIVKFISERTGTAPRFFNAVDSVPLLERAVALRAGLGWLGQNAFVCSKKYGTYLVLGEILIDLEFEPDKPLKSRCLECGSCMEACPSNAIIKPHTIDPRRCISYLTQSKEDIPREFRSSIGQRIVGCDACQDACPVNKQIEEGRGDCFKPLPQLKNIGPLDILKMNNKEFKEIFRDSAAAWCGRRILQRNALVVLANKGEGEYVEEIMPFLADQRPQIKRHAAWALGELGGSKAEKALRKRLNIEKDPLLKEEIIEALL